MMPRISVIMSVYNSARFLAEAIQSILGQTYNDFEFIIVDDGSSDQSLEIIRSYAKMDNRIRVLENEKKYGLAASLNRCIFIAKGDYIARMDADDICVPDRLEKQIAFLEQHPNIGIIGGSVQEIDGQGQKGRIRKFLQSPKHYTNVKSTSAAPSDQSLWIQTVSNIVNRKRKAAVLPSRDYIGRCQGGLSLCRDSPYLESNPVFAFLQQLN